MKKKGLVLFSGGLDSLLSVKLLLESNVQVTALIFKSCFWSIEKSEKKCKQLDIDYIIKDISEEHLQIVKKPQYGRGQGINPCIDCHLLMFKKAKRILDEEGFDFVVTGEVLGQRLFSQDKRAMELLKKESGLGGYLLRPLSAKLLETSIPEKKGWVDDEILLDIQGRTRRRQMDLAKKFDLNYPQPAGGCILTDLHFATELKKMFAKWPECNCNDINLLKTGRHFWNNQTLIVLGRNEGENKRLASLSDSEDVLVIPKNFPGPSALLRNPQHQPTSADANKAKKLILKYSKSEKIKTKRRYIET
jgi:hypothetical protein